MWHMTHSEYLFRTIDLQDDPWSQVSLSLLHPSDTRLSWGFVAESVGPVLIFLPAAARRFLNVAHSRFQRSAVITYR